MIPNEFCVSPVLATCATAGTATTSTIASIAASSIDFLNFVPLLVLLRSLRIARVYQSYPNTEAAGIPFKEFSGRCEKVSARAPAPRRDVVWFQTGPEPLTQRGAVSRSLGQEAYAISLELISTTTV